MFRQLLVNKHTTIYIACALGVFFQPVIAQAKQLSKSQSTKVSHADIGKFNYLSDIGIVAVNSHPSIFIINNACLKAGSQVILVFPEIPQKIAEATILHKTKLPAVTEPRQSAYTVKLLHYMSATPELAIGILSYKSRFQINKGCIHANLVGDGFKNTFRIAYSEEGAHLTVWNGQPLIGQRKWHGYFHFDYEVEPNGTPKDY